MAGSQELHLVYKNVGETPLQAIFRYKKENPEYKNTDFTYAGRLDPMAEGLLILLSGENLKKKDDFLSLDKTYEVQVLWGVTTDTGDLLGKIVTTDLESDVSENAVSEYLLQSVGEFMQSYPIYSSKTVNGKQLHLWAREGRISEIELPTHKVEIYSSKYLERETVDTESFLQDLKNKINKVTGDFRQEEIMKLWEENLNNANQNLAIDKFVVSSSSGFYVRQFVLDMGKKLNLPATTFSIKRIKIGDYSIADIK